MRRQTFCFWLLLGFIGAHSAFAQTKFNPPSLNEAAASKTDVYGDAAMAQPNGASYEFFRALIPPLHYVNTDFQHYPIVLSAPASPHKTMLVANGSALNARANSRAWTDTGIPVLFRVGNDELAFGQYLQKLDGPKFTDRWLPIVQLTYHHGGGEYAQETFASVDPMLASNAVSLSRFTFKTDDPGVKDIHGHMTVRFETTEPLKAENNRVLNAKGDVLAWFDKNWKWAAARRSLEANLLACPQATIAICKIPSSTAIPSPVDNDGFKNQRETCVKAWTKILDQGVNIETPEPYVNNAWHALIVANFSLIVGDKMFYSYGNGYEKLYEQEGSEAALALMLYGQEEEFRRLLPPLLDFTRKGLEYHQAGFKLDDICRFYWQTRDAKFVNDLRPRWQKEVERLATHRAATNGLYPREQYCGDIATPVFSMNSNSKGWRAMHDTAALLDALGDKAEAERLRKTSDDFHKDILAAANQSARKEGDAMFVPVALFNEEQPYDTITATRMGSYWNLMANNILGTEVFGQNSEMETGMCRYFQQHGGLFMGLVRSRPWPAFWVSTSNMNPLYGWYYARTLLRRDEPGRALVSFYGMLAAGFTQDTFICGEGCAIQPVDKWGRQFYLPPNSAGNAYFLLMLRHLLVQDWDLNGDGEPETLRLLFATPKRWLEDGKRIKVERAPTAFGLVSLVVESKLNDGKVLTSVDLPRRNPAKQTLLRIRVPDGWKVISAKAGADEFAVDEQGTTDISKLSGNVHIEFRVIKK